MLIRIARSVGFSLHFEPLTKAVRYDFFHKGGLLLKKKLASSANWIEIIFDCWVKSDAR